MFGLVSHFETGEPQLWRLNRTATRGRPMDEWDDVFRWGGTWTILMNSLFR